MANLEAEFGASKADIQRGIVQLKEHPSVIEILKIDQDQDNRCVEVTASIQLGLPNQWMAVGGSPNGVRVVEPVTFSFPSSFPIHAPAVKLRSDFDRSLAHVQSGSLEGPIYPCFYDGDSNELLHEQGLWAIVNQVVLWLEKAALNELIDPKQGWEPIRRDTLEDVIVADSDYLRSLVSGSGSFVFLAFTYLKLKKRRSHNQSPKQYVCYGQVDNRLLKPKEFRGLFDEWETEMQVIAGNSLALAIFPDRLPSGELFIAKHYLPESVTNLDSLHRRVKDYGCVKSLKAALAGLEAKLRNRDFEELKRPILLILCVRRPFPLIDETSEIELIPYIVEVGAPKLFVEGTHTPVFPAAHKYAITPKLLQKFSGEASSVQNQDIVLVGCGSLGSKIGIHMARSGTAPSSGVDKGSLSPHNATRHALLPGEMEFMWCLSKAKALAFAVRNLGQTMRPFDQDVTQIVHNPKLLNALFPRNVWAIVNTTASLTVREALAKIEPNKLPSRVIETSLFANGKIGLLTVEGPARNPNSVDLIAESYRAMKDDSKLRSAVFEHDSQLHRRSTGQGCGSNTMIVSDASLSIMAAAMAQAITQMRSTGLPESGGHILLGVTTDDDLGLNWTPFHIPPAHVISIDGMPSWTVRLSERVHQEILRDCAKHTQVETGGILIGRIFESQQAFVVTDLIPAPMDSKRSRSQFMLGVADLHIELEKYTSSCQAVLSCLGTWHSHLNNSGPSSLDMQTAATIAASRIAPSVLLIKTPLSYQAIVATTRIPH